jgi:hypothetical protein
VSNALPAHLPATPTRHAFVFVCQAGELEIKALLLAASLKRYLRCAHELIAAVPTPASTWGELTPETRELLQQLGVRIEPIVNPIDPDYKIGNKLACLDVPTRADRIVFLDSDILCLRDFGEPDCLRVPFAAKPADLRTFAAGAEAWAPLYAAAGVALPDLRLPTTVSGEFGLAYFNSGVIFAAAAAGLGRVWIDCARTILQVPAMREQRHWLDQVSLAIAVHKLGLSYSGLDERFNFPAHLKPVPDEQPFFCHYHWPRIVRGEPVLIDLVRDLAREYPAIARRMAHDEEWATLLDAPPHRPQRPSAVQRTASAAATILIAGIPDSGADELLKPLRGFDRCIAQDEPAELIALLAASGPPWEVAAHVRSVRAGKRGEVWDSHYRQPSDDAGEPGDTIVAIKSALGFLCRLDALQRVLPHARVAVCVRNPFDTIARWKARPAAELDAVIASLADSAPYWAAAHEVAALRRVVALTHAAEKRAAWWWLLAQRVLNRSGDVVLVRHGDLAADRGKVLGSILGRACHATATNVARSEQATAALDADDLQAIRAICLQAAAELGVAERGS